jgi:hypothetical protein
MRPESENLVRKFFESNDPSFIAACETVKIKATRRQTSKWLRGKGLAYKSLGV